MSTVITTGIVSPNGQTPLVERQEIRTFRQDEDLMNIFLLGFERFQSIDQSNPLSYYQIAGIHGRPYVPYSGAGNRTNFAGYCTHSSILFPTWHRPYLALLEQTLAMYMKQVANEFPNPAERHRYLAAVDRFRFPYWDWAQNADVPDFISKQENVTVNTPQGIRSIPNPLYSYRFHPVDSTFGDGLGREEAKWESWTSTLRFPSTRDESAQSRANIMDANLGSNGNRSDLRNRTFNLLTQAKTYTAFSNDGFRGTAGNPTRFDSLEAIHGSIHVLTGLGGHMSVVDFAAFDPIFWLHHCNVDRLFAIWQAINPGEYVVPRRTGGNTFVSSRGDREDTNTPLQPFWKTNREFWTSEGVRDTRTFNYTYPELRKWGDLTSQQKSERLTEEVNELYGRGAPFAAIVPDLFVPTNQRQPMALTASVARKAVAVSQAEEEEAPPAEISAMTVAEEPTPVPASAQLGTPQEARIEQAPLAVSEPESISITKAPAPPKKQYTEWLANITVEKYAANNSFVVYIFLGDFTPDDEQWGTDPNLVGTYAVFTNKITSTGCGRCQEAAERHERVTGTVPLTAALGERLGADKIGDLTPEEVTPYLTRNLHWRIRDIDGIVLERGDLPGFKVSVAHVPVDVPDTITQFPTWHEALKDVNVTVGRPGGAGEEEDVMEEEDD